MSVLLVEMEIKKEPCKYCEEEINEVADKAI
jgi:hypothetical protein